MQATFVLFPDKDGRVTMTVISEEELIEVRRLLDRLGVLFLVTDVTEEETE